MKTKVILASLLLLSISACTQDERKQSSNLDLKIQCEEPKVEPKEMPLVDNDETFFTCDEADYLNFCTVQKQAVKIDYDRYDQVIAEPLKMEVINFENEHIAYTPFAAKDVPQRLYPTVSQIVLQTKNIDDERVIEE